MPDTTTTDASEPRSVFESDLALDMKLERARTELLDLSARNRLLNIPRSAKSAKTLEISYPILGDKLVCRVDVKRSRTPVYLALSEGNSPATERLIVRAGASSPEIPLGQVAAYVRDHFTP